MPEQFIQSHGITGTADSATNQVTTKSSNNLRIITAYVTLEQSSLHKDTTIWSDADVQVLPRLFLPSCNGTVILADSILGIL